MDHQKRYGCKSKKNPQYVISKKYTPTPYRPPSPAPPITFLLHKVYPFSVFLFTRPFPMKSSRQSKFLHWGRVRLNSDDRHCLKQNSDKRHCLKQQHKPVEMAKNDTKMVEAAVVKSGKCKYNSQILTTTIGLPSTFWIKESTGEDSSQ